MTPETKNIDLTKELGELLRFVSSSAKALRMCSVYNSDYQNIPDKDCDIMWLSDSLHNLDILTEAIETGKAEQINYAALDLIDLFQVYVDPKGKSKSDPRETFARWEKVSLTSAIETFQTIARKTGN